jgi:hypothetical protein
MMIDNKTMQEIKKMGVSFDPIFFASNGAKLIFPPCSGVKSCPLQ